MVIRDEQATDAVFDWIKEHYLVLVDYDAHVIAFPQGREKQGHVSGNHSQPLWNLMISRDKSQKN